MQNYLIRKLFILFFSLGFLSSCSPEESNDLKRRLKDSSLLDNLEDESVESEVSLVNTVSAFTLDDKKFDVVRLAVGLQSFMSSESPVLSYKLPKDADYVEILRCDHDVQLTVGTTPTPLVDLELSGVSDAKKASLYRSNDYFKAGESSAGCELVSDGHAGEEFVDSFSPSGSFRYMVRACVSPKRLVDKDKLTGRNCSKRVAVSYKLPDYFNLRKKKTNEALKLAAVYSARIDATATSMRVTAENANIELDACEDRNHDRLVAKRLRDAWLTIAAAVIEVAVEFKTVRQPGEKGSIASFYYKRGGLNVDMFQLLGAAQGYVLADTFIKIAGSSNDMVRSCDTYKRLMDEYRIEETALGRYGFKFQYYTEIAQLARTDQLAAGGEDVQIPQLEMRDFQDVDVPQVNQMPPEEESSGEDSDADGSETSDNGTDGS